jgi:16S rRNA (cytosine967-C5)-methyltransferase
VTIDNATSLTPQRTAPRLADQLLEVARCVAAVEQGRSLSEVIPRVAPALRPGVQALTFEVLRHLGVARAVGRLLARRAPAPLLQALLHTALALLIGDSDAARYPAHTLVDQAIEAAKRDKGTRAQSGFLNACLRRYLREHSVLLPAALHEPEAKWNHPLWWVERLQRDHPEHWASILGANNRAGPMVLRANRRKTSRQALITLLADHGIEASPLGEDGLVLARPRPVEGLPGFAQGLWSVQDGAAQLAAPLLLEGLVPAAGARVLDACAAPGGKTAHLLEMADLDLLALDVDPRRCERIHANLQRLCLRAEVKAADAAAPAMWWDGRAFDAILLDAPCTASGIVRRHPDVRWLRRASDVDQLARLQRHLLDTLWPLLKPGGRLLYCTCSVFAAEGRDQVVAFLERHTDALARPSPGHLLPGTGVAECEFNDNAPGGYDGFYFARLDKALP